MILVPQPGTEAGPLAVKAQNPNHCITREFPNVSFLDEKYIHCKKVCLKEMGTQDSLRMIGS